jgi:hypothetical protein
MVAGRDVHEIKSELHALVRDGRRLRGEYRNQGADPEPFLGLEVDHIDRDVVGGRFFGFIAHCTALLGEEICMRYSVRKLLIVVALSGGISWGIREHIKLYYWYQAGCPGGKSPKWVKDLVESIDRALLSSSSSS